MVALQLFVWRGRASYLNRLQGGLWGTILVLLADY